MEPGEGDADQLSSVINHVEMIFDAITDSLTIYNREGHLLHANQAAIGLLALNRCPQIGSLKLGELAQLLHVRDEAGKPLPRERWALARILNGEQLADACVAKTLIRALDGRDVLLSESGAPLYDANHQLIGAVLLSKTVTAAEQQTEDFISLAAHELRIPLTTLLGYTEMLKQQTGGRMGAELAEWQMEALETITHDVTRLVELTNDLLDIARLPSWPLEVQRYTADLTALVQRVVTRTQTKTTRHRLSTRIASFPITASFDVQSIERVLTNLISNALKYSPPGSEILLTVAANQEARVATLAVRDQGIGIPESQQPRIFSRFFRADNAKALGIEGTGLGLYLCRALIELHNGHIWFESVEGEGSTFSISLPLVPGQVH